MCTLTNLQRRNFNFAQGVRTVLESTKRMNEKDINKLESSMPEVKFTYLISFDTPFDFGREVILQTKKKEMGIMGNPRSVEEYDEEGFLGMLNQLEKETGKLIKAVILK